MGISHVFVQGQIGSRKRPVNTTRYTAGIPESFIPSFLEYMKDCYGNHDTATSNSDVSDSDTTTASILTGDRDDDNDYSYLDNCNLNDDDVEHQNPYTRVIRLQQVETCLPNDRVMIKVGVKRWLKYKIDNLSLFEQQLHHQSHKKPAWARHELRTTFPSLLVR
ncbi:hypothetical protein BDR26DRAFT_863458 [Obelidium mucronatum]|nr:hypothetical protein BDR26DRAFT_863458 [Obelidium mucronatum]